MNMEQVDPEKGQENETLAEPQKESKTILLHMKETLNDHQDTNLSKILKEKDKIEVRIRDFDIDCVLDEETQMNFMIERTWEVVGKPIMILSLRGIGLFRGRLITLCGRLTQISMRAHGTLKILRLLNLLITTLHLLCY
jgi:hypothetical protein